MITGKTYIILNPASAGGKTEGKKRKIITEIRTQLGNGFKISETQSEYEAIDLARDAIISGYKNIIAIGGDGTIHEIINGFFENGNLIDPECKLGIISSGTGQGFAQSIGLPNNLKEQITIIKAGHSNKVDVGRISFSNSVHNNGIRYFANEFQVGIGGEVVKNVKSDLKRLGGLLSYGLGTLRVAFGFEGQPMTFLIDNRIVIENECLGAVIGNGAFTAGGMSLTPKAKMNDGLFDFLLIHNQSKVQRLKNFPKVYSGKHLASNKFSYWQASKIEISANSIIPMEADGEPFSFSNCSVEVLPQALAVFTKPQARNNDGKFS